MALIIGTFFHNPESDFERKIVQDFFRTLVYCPIFLIQRLQSNKSLDNRRINRQNHPWK